MISKFKILLIALLAMLGMMPFESLALNDGFFTQESKLATGKWVKISVEENGVYEISYDELRQMGFENPEKVAIYGRGGEEQPDQFVDDSSEALYVDDLQPVAVMHKGEKLYFYGQGPVRIRYKYELTNPASQRFVRQNLNTYSNYGYYFLTDSRDDMLIIADAIGTSGTTALTECWDYFYHEKELVNINKSGQVFLGESMAEEGNRELTVPYSIPGAVTSTKGSLECVFYANNGSGSKFEFGVGEPTISSEISACTGNYTYRSPGTTKFEIGLTSESGDIVMKYTPSGQVTTANLDYILLGARKTIGFHNGQSQFRAFIPDYTSSKYVEISNATETTVAWDVTSSQDVKNLPIEYADGVAKAKYFTVSKKDGMMMVFDTAKSQKTISSFKVVANQNIHGSETPDLLIITVPSLYSKAEELAEIHREYDGIDVLVVDSEAVINEFSAGTPDAMAYRAVAKMFYDRNPEKFKNILLFGEYSYDNRQLTFSNPKEMLISYQTKESNIFDKTFNVGDYYGMLSDYYPASQSNGNMHYRAVQVGVGHLPCRDIGDADIVINKVAQYIVDDSYAYWLGNLQYLADGTDENEHQGQCEDLVTQVNGIAGGAFAINKVYLNAYKKGDDKYKMLQNFNDGMLLSTYFGHAAYHSLTMCQSLWYLSDAWLLYNKRLSFMNFAACSVSHTDGGVRGSAECMLFEKEVGIIGGLMANRNAYSTQNYHLMTYFNECCFLENPNESKLEMLSTRRTIGEIYAMTKTNCQRTENEHGYQLIADPALVIPLPTTSVQIDKMIVDGTEYTEEFAVAPGMEIEISGSIVNRDGSSVDDFNGILVARVFDTPVVIKTMGNYSAAVDIEYDEKVLSTTDFEVSGGKFTGKIILPRTLTPTTDKLAYLRFSAYDAEKRLASLGAVKVNVGVYDESKAIIDSQAPVVDEMYINNSDFSEGDVVGKEFTLYATISDDRAVKLTANDVETDLLLVLDNSKVYSNVVSYTTLSNGGKTLKISFPIEGLEYGYHTLTLTASDLMDNTVNRSISFRVYEGEIGGELMVENIPARENVTIKMTLANADIEQSGRLYVVDSLGNTVFDDEILGAEYIWDLKDNSGNRVSQGVYYAHVKLEATDIIKGFTPAVKIVVLKEKE